MAGNTRAVIGLSGCLPDARIMNRPASPETIRSVPISNEHRLVVPDTLGYNDQARKLGSLEGPARLAPADYRQRVRCCHLYIGPAVVTCLEVRWHPGFLV
jgi:hypothetical protein